MDSKLREKIATVILEQAITIHGCSAPCNCRSVADSILSLLAPVLADAEKWKNHQQDLALANAEIERFVTLMQAEEAELRRDAEKWRKIKEIAEWEDKNCGPACPAWDTCTNCFCGSAKSFVDALESEGEKG